MADFRTTMSHLSSAEICRQQGWGALTILVADPLPKYGCRDRQYVMITAVGRESILVRDLPWDLEYVLDLHTRDWLPDSVVPFSPSELERMEVL